MTSTVHAQGQDLERLAQLASATRERRALDLGSGAGHVSFALARGGAKVIAYDLSPQMLTVVAAEAEAMLGVAGFTEPVIDRWKLHLEFKSWIARIATPAPRIEALKTIIDALPSEVRAYFEVAADRSFSTDAAWFEAISSSPAAPNSIAGSPTMTAAGR